LNKGNGIVRGLFPPKGGLSCGVGDETWWITQLGSRLEKKAAHPLGWEGVPHIFNQRRTLARIEGQLKASAKRHSYWPTPFLEAFRRTTSPFFQRPGLYLWGKSICLRRSKGSMKRNACARGRRGNTSAVSGRTRKKQHF